MQFLFGLFVVIFSVIAGYTYHYGELALLWQPAEYIIIIGSAIGAFIIANPFDKLMSNLKALAYIFKVRPYNKDNYLDLLSLHFNVFKLMKMKGMLAIESHVDAPENSEIFNNSPSVLENERATLFITDYLRVMTMGVDNAYMLEELMDREVEQYDKKESFAYKAYQTMGDSFPALGIVAAVLGVIITMRSITEPPEILGGLIGAALVGTFTGVLVAYGIVLPISGYLKSYSEQKVVYMNVIKTGFLSHINGNAPIITVEFMRKNIPEHLRPSFQETDEYISNNSKNFS